MSRFLRSQFKHSTISVVQQFVCIYRTPYPVGSEAHLKDSLCLLDFFPCKNSFIILFSDLCNLQSRFYNSRTKKMQVTSKQLNDLEPQKNRLHNEVMSGIPQNCQSSVQNSTSIHESSLISLLNCREKQKTHQIRDAN